MKETCIHKGCAAFLFPYFEGWYLKHQNRDDTIAFIPAVHADQNGQWTVSLQIVTEEGSWYFTYPKEACRVRYEFWLGDGLVFDIISEQASFEQADESEGSTYFTSLHSPQ